MVFKSLHAFTGTKIFLDNGTFTDIVDITINKTIRIYGSDKTILNANNENITFINAYPSLSVVMGEQYIGMVIMV